MRVWVTRAQPGAGETASRLRALGREALVAPVLEVRRLDVAAPDLEGVGALAFTSANGVRAFAEASSRRDLPVFAVGDATAATAEAVGFAGIRSADGDVDALAKLIAEARPALAGHVLHPCATEWAGDLQGLLRDQGIKVLSAPLYETVETTGLPKAATAALDAGAVDVVLVHSPKAGRVLARLFAPPERQAQAHGLRLLGVSAGSLAPLAAVAFRSRAHPPAPREALMLALIG